MTLLTCPVGHRLRPLAVALSLVAGGCSQAPTDLPPTQGPATLATNPALLVAATVTLAQLDVSLDDGGHPDSPWGQALVDFTGASEVLYFNLAFNGIWRIRNLPVLSREGPGVAQTTTFLFDLGAADGTDVTAGALAFDLTTTVLAEMPSAAANAAVGTDAWAINTGTVRGEIAYSPPAPNLIGGAAAGDKVGHRGFPNQQAGMNECVPVALSNSLQWLNSTYSLGLAEADIAVAAMKGLVGWGAGGAPQQWWTKKRTRFKDLLTTSTIPRFNIGEVYDAVARGCDVELRANDHVVAVTGAQKLADGKYSLDLTHDPDQKDGKAPGAEGTQTVTWDPKAKRFSGAPWIEGKAADLIVVECPKQRT